MATDEEKQRIRQDLQEYATGTLDEWLRNVHILQTEEYREGRPVRINWEAITDGTMIASLSESGHDAEYGRYGITVTVDILPDLPPIGPENDPAMAHETRGQLTTSSHPCIECMTDPTEDPRAWCDCGGRTEMGECKAPCVQRAHGVDECPNAPEECRCSRTEKGYCHALNCHGGADVIEWVPATLLYCLAGDRIRIGPRGQWLESDVLRSSSGAWHANVVSSVLPSGKTWDKVTPWQHTELRLELTANPGFKPYPQDFPCEILMTAERRAVHLLMSAFPGTTRVDAPPVDK